MLTEQSDITVEELTNVRLAGILPSFGILSA